MSGRTKSSKPAKPAPAAERRVAPPKAEAESGLEFVVDETAEPGDTTAALAALLLDLVKKEDAQQGGT